MTFRMKKLCFLMTLFCILFPSSILARWASQKEAGLRYDLWRSVIKVEKDGTYTQEVEFKVKILKDSAIDSFVSFFLTYNGQSQEVEVLSAKTINKGKEFLVDSQFIEDKPLASAPSGFDQSRQILIAFPHVQVGSDVYLRYRYHFKIIPYKGFFSYSKIFSQSFFKHIELNIESALPLYYELNNPQNFLKSSYRVYRNKKRKYKFKLSLRRPLFKDILDEKYVFPNLDLFPWVEISSEKKWSEMVKPLVPKYREKIAEPLPEIYQRILKSSRQIKTGPEDQIDFIISSLIEKIRYMGDWRPINGGYVPRSLSVIAKTGFGDCKDLSVSLSAILRNLGFKANVALVSRNSKRHSSNTYKMPNAKAFNHAIVRAERNGKVFWLDPTNTVSYSRGLFTDIADRPALVLQNDKSRMENIPKLNSSDSEYNIIQNFKITRDNLVNAVGSIHFKGRSAIGFTGVSLNQSKKSIDYHFIQFTGADVSSLKKWQVTGYDLSSRIVKDFSVKISYTMEEDSGSFGYRTQLGPVFSFPRPFEIGLFFIRTSERVSDLFLGQPRRVVLISKLKNIKPVGDLKFNCDIKSKWIDVNRTMESLKPLVIKDIYEFKKPQMSAKELKSSSFVKFQRNIKRCFVQFLMIYEKTD